MKKIIAIFTITLILISLTSCAQSTNNDKEEAKNTVENFFEWYLEVVSKGLSEEFQPQFQEDINGQVTLKMDKYIDNLRKYHFSEMLITNEIKSYKTCIDNLKRVKYSYFENEWTDLDQFEAADCDYGNYYRWTGGQEPINAIQVTKVTRIEDGIYQVEIVYDEYDSSKDEHHLWGNNTITLKKESDVWCINSINWK